MLRRKHQRATWTGPIPWHQPVEDRALAMIAPGWLRLSVERLRLAAEETTDLETCQDHLALARHLEGYL